ACAASWRATASVVPAPLPPPSSDDRITASRSRLSWRPDPLGPGVGVSSMLSKSDRSRGFLLVIVDRMRFYRSGSRLVQACYRLAHAKHRCAGDRGRRVDCCISRPTIAAGGDVAD